MDKFIEFLQMAKEACQYLGKLESIHLVLGNESCDLDSTVSALALAYLEYHKCQCQTPVIPVMNVSEKHFCLRTETCHVLKESGIGLDLLVFKDRLNLQELMKCKNLKVSLVDHHVLCPDDKILEPYVVQIFDHRQINTQDICQTGRKVIEPVGSCATLIAREVNSTRPDIIFKELCQMLYATVIYDTIGLEEGCGKTTSEDISMAEHLENVLGKTASNRKFYFHQLHEVHKDTSGIQTRELLYRDLKIVKRVPIPGLPVLAEDYLKREDAASALISFADEFKCPLVVLIGIDAKEDVRRDIAVHYKDANLKNELVGILMERKDSKGGGLCLEEVHCSADSTVCFRQGNIKLTRKFILPLVDEAVARFSSNKGQ